MHSSRCCNGFLCTRSVHNITRPCVCGAKYRVGTEISRFPIFVWGNDPMGKVHLFYKMFTVYMHTDVGKRRHCRASNCRFQYLLFWFGVYDGLLVHSAFMLAHRHNLLALGGVCVCLWVQHCCREIAHNVQSIRVWISLAACCSCVNRVLHVESRYAHGCIHRRTLEQIYLVYFWHELSQTGCTVYTQGTEDGCGQRECSEWAAPLHTFYS